MFIIFENTVIVVTEVATGTSDLLYAIKMEDVIRFHPTKFSNMIFLLLSKLLYRTVPSVYCFYFTMFQYENIIYQSIVLALVAVLYYAVKFESVVPV